MERLKKLDSLLFKDILNDRAKYAGIIDGLTGLLCPDKIRIGHKYYKVPQTLDELTQSICYGQKLFLTEIETDDMGMILRIMDGYFYPDVWDRDKALLFGRKILNCKAVDLFPVALQLITLVGDLVERESKMLSRKPTPEEIAAGIDKLNIFAELSAIKYLRAEFNLDRNEDVLLLPYADCLVRFIQAKEEADYNERLKEVYERKNKK